MTSHFPSSIALAVFLVLLASAPLHAQEKPRVAVRFELVEPAFRGNFRSAPDGATGRSELDALHESVSAQIAAVLGSEIGFGRFSTEPAGAFRLDIKLKGEQTSNPNLVKTFYQISMSGLPESAPKEVVQWEFRSDQDFFLPVDPETFDRTLAQRFAGHVRQRKQELVDAFFSHLPVAKDALLIIDAQANQIFCAFPVSYDHLQANIDTTFRVKTRRPSVVPESLLHYAKGLDVPLSGLAIPVPETFLSGVLATEHAPPPLDSEHSSFREVLPHGFNGDVLEISTDGIYIHRYVRKVPSVISEANPLDLQL